MSNRGFKVAVAATVLAVGISASTLYGDCNARSQAIEAKKANPAYGATLVLDDAYSRLEKTGKLLEYYYSSGYHYPQPLEARLALTRTINIVLPLHLDGKAAENLQQVYDSIPLEKETRSIDGLKIDERAYKAQRDSIESVRNELWVQKYSKLSEVPERLFTTENMYSQHIIGWAAATVISLFGGMVWMGFEHS